MNSPDDFHVRPLTALFLFELHRLLAGRALWALLLVLALLTGYGYVEAVRLFGEASRTALQFPEFARGMTPLDGILVPTLGSLYLGTTLLFPFVAIRALGQDRESGSIKLVLQWPLSAQQLIAVKLAAVGTVWLLTLLVPMSAMVLWMLAGGHLAWAESVNLLFGHALYALTVSGVALVAAVLTESAATAAIVVLAFTLGCWALDFATSTGPEWLKILGTISPTQALRSFERGLFPMTQAAALGIMGLGSAGVAAWLLPSGLAGKTRLRYGFWGLAAILALLAASLFVHAAKDMSENQRNSFNPADEAALARMDKELLITLHLNPDDSRAREFSDNVMAKLRRLVPHLRVIWADTGKAGVFGTAQDEGYGRIVYGYAGRSAESRSNSPREILPLLHALAGAQVIPVDTPSYPGYPLLADTQAAQIWFYLALPILIWLAAWRLNRRGHIPSHLMPTSGEQS